MCYFIKVLDVVGRIMLLEMDNQCLDFLNYLRNSFMQLFIFDFGGDSFDTEQIWDTFKITVNTRIIYNQILA